MSSTLNALYRAVIENPTDRTVRLVYADALDETGHEADAARAEFIRLQIEAETLTESTDRAIACRSRACDLFHQHWPQWWHSVCVAMGLPEPHVPGRRRPRGSPPRPRRQRNWPYTHNTATTTVQMPEPEHGGITVRFAGGFPEDVRLLNLDLPEAGPGMVHNWGEVIPLVRLTFGYRVSPAEWERVSGSHLARLPELCFERLSPEAAEIIAASPCLAALQRLSIGVSGAEHPIVRSVVAAPAWSQLQVLRFTGWIAPEAIRDLASACTLEHLEELDLAIGDPNSLAGMMGRVLRDVIRRFTQAITFLGITGPPWRDYGPALEALAAAPWVRRLRRLRFSTGGPLGVLGLLGGRFNDLPAEATQDADVIPDAALITLANALDIERLEQLELPNEIVTVQAREALTARLGNRVLYK